MLVLEVVASCTCCLGFNLSSILGAALSVDSVRESVGGESLSLSKALSTELLW